MRRLPLIVALLWFPLLVLAGTVRLDWTLPTTNTDGSALPAVNITQSRAEYGKCTGTPPALLWTSTTGQWIVNGNAITSQSPNLPGGTYCFRVFVTSNLPTAPGESNPSNAALGVIPAALPGPATGLTVTVQVADNNAYKMRQALGDYSFVVIGTVPVGTPCSTAHNNDGYSLIDRTAVKLASRFDTLPVLVFAKCS